ncbi:MAG: prepilin-type N-terminal cleavage/methylation domain-containing protein [Planctomycetota bacterium]|nr:MAG: prepilin-type N-terminal cleavage/methylation domain-containing protein [Planctomycetota bacterium]
MFSTPGISLTKSTYNTSESRAFTLIEVLVVVAIIALLAAILLPSLSRAREQAYIASCMANCKQIGTLVSTYKSEYKGYVPVMFNYSSRNVLLSIGGFNDPESNITWFPPARTSYLSVALRAYDKSTIKLSHITDTSGKRIFDPDDYLSDYGSGIFNDVVHGIYERQNLPKHYTCPFARDDGEGYQSRGSLTIRGPNGTVDFQVLDWTGKHEAYHTWLWEGLVVRNEPPIYGHNEYEIHPNDPRDGRAKYSTLSWCKVYSPGSPPDIVKTVSPSFVERVALKSINLHRKWNAKDAQRLKSGSLADVTVLHCAEGMYMGRLARLDDGTTRRRMYNIDSHRTSLGAGSNAIFADSHVEWVKGTQIGW